MILMNGEYKIVSDDCNVILQKRYEKKDGSFDYKSIAYYGTPQQALKGLIQKDIRGTGFEDFETVCARLTLLENEVTNKCMK